MPKKLQWLPIVLLGCMFVILLFPSWFKHANSRVVEPYGDGYKAYHAILYHAKYDTTFSWYGGMNYPYGEHVVPGASQPLLSNGMKVLDRLGLPASDHGWAIVHFSMLLGIVLSMLFTFLLLRRMGVDWRIATLGALFMGLMAPQLDRIIAHYGLAHPEVLPAVLYCLKRWDEQPGWRPALGVAACVWIFSQIHFYYFAILAFTIGGFLAARWLITRDWKRWWFYGLQLGIMFGIPAIYFFTWFGLTDPVSDRNEAPWGFFQFTSSRGGIFTSHTQPHWQWFSERVDYFYPGFEGWAYIGLPAIGFIIYLIGRWAYRQLKNILEKPSFSTAVTSLFQTPVLVTGKDKQTYLQSLLLAAAGLVVFSFGWPITKFGGADWLEHLGPLRQFRSVGRFAWLFFYAINLALFVELYRGIQRNSGWKRYLPLLLVIGIATLEVSFFWKAKNFQLDEIKDLSTPTLAEQTGLNFADYQAIIPVPYYNIGSDNFWWDQSGFIGQKVQSLSWQTGLSTTAAMLTRTSLQQTLHQLQLITEPYRRPALLDDLPNQKPFLLAFDAHRYQSFGDHSAHLAIGSKLVYNAPPFQLYELPIASWEQRIQERVAAVVQALEQDTLITMGPFLTTDSMPFIYEDFAGNSTFYHSDYQSSYKQADSNYVGDLGESNYLLDIRTGIALPPGDYSLSFWIDIAQDRVARSQFKLQTRVGNQQAGPAFESHVREWVRVMDNDGRALVEFPVKLTQTTTGLQLVLSMPLLKGQPLSVDDVLLRPANQQVYRQFEQMLYFNNRYYPDPRR